ncbi:hypothetical protein AVEN_84458-1 [Araneus ventricosus]|uniref:Uncharacterized protein n=1 Tax=Araneus ventricosus TaxID=182803 RepID=A0A4Y2QYS4_ARAVE|nr:hypothetical protein AVEN_84458-1 [Araneus ventricosus]
MYRTVTVNHKREKYPLPMKTHRKILRTSKQGFDYTLQQLSTQNSDGNVIISLTDRQDIHKSSFVVCHTFYLVIRRCVVALLSRWACKGRLISNFTAVCVEKPALKRKVTCSLNGALH